VFALVGSNLSYCYRDKNMEEEGIERLPIFNGVVAALFCDNSQRHFCSLFLSLGQFYLDRHGRCDITTKPNGELQMSKGRPTSMNNLLKRLELSEGGFATCMARSKVICE